MSTSNQEVRRTSNQEVAAATAPPGSAHSHDKGHNRDARRTVSVVDLASKLADTGWHPHVSALIQIERSVYTRSAKTGLLRHSAETTFSVANTPVAATRTDEATRAHWTIETTSHYSRAVTLAEDRSRLRTNPDMHSQDRYRAGLAGIRKLLRMLVVSWR